MNAAEGSKLTQEAERVGNAAYQFLQRVAGADASQIPHEVVAPFQRWVQGLGIANTMFFRSEHLPNYELGTFDLKNYGTLPTPHPDLTAALNAFNSLPILRVTVPGLAMGMLPHFAVVAHELGHAIQDKIVFDWAPHHLALQACDLALNTRLTSLAINPDQKVKVEIATIISRWLNELKADAVGLSLVGPAFYFALCGFLELSSRGLGIAHTHPPSDLRRQLLLNQLSVGTPSFSHVFESHTGIKISAELNSPHIATCPPTAQLFRLLKKDGELTAAICAELVPLMQVVGPSVFLATTQYMNANCPSLVYTAANLEADLTDHLIALCKLVPPIESRKAGTTQAVALSGILNVGWLRCWAS